MAKKFDIHTAKNGEHIPCPYCGKTGVLVSKVQDGWLITHGHKWMTARSQATGKEVRCEVLWDGCRMGKKVGRAHEAVEEEITFEEEELRINE